jgi:fumarylpyruvate hydrolase
MTRLFALPDRPLVPIADTTLTFPVRRVFCVGRNYAAHAREMGKDPEREPPFFFTKFADAVVPGRHEIPYPPSTHNYQYEAELVIAIGKEGAALNPDTARAIIYGYAAGLDMTRRDLQLESRAKGQPWDMGKNFAFSAPVAPIRPVEGHGHINSGAIALRVNGHVQQKADIGDLIWNCAEVVAYLSDFERLLSGDLIFTGTPAGVGAVNPGDHIEVTIEGLQPLHLVIGPREPEFAR